MDDKLVIDASVAAKWFLNDEGDADLAIDILMSLLAGVMELHAPRVFVYDVCALIAKARAGSKPRISRPDGIEAIRKFLGIDVKLFDLTEPGAIRSFELASDSSKTFKDMTYLHLAEHLDCKFCTADTKVTVSVPRTYPLHRIVLLSSLRTTPPTASPPP